MMHRVVHYHTAYHRFAHDRNGLAGSNLSRVSNVGLNKVSGAIESWRDAEVALPTPSPYWYLFPGSGTFVTCRMYRRRSGLRWLDGIASSAS